MQSVTRLNNESCKSILLRRSYDRKIVETWMNIANRMKQATLELWFFWNPNSTILKCGGHLAKVPNAWDFSDFGHFHLLGPAEVGCSRGLPHLRHHRRWKVALFRMQRSRPVRCAKALGAFRGVSAVVMRLGWSRWNVSIYKHCFMRIGWAVEDFSKRLRQMIWKWRKWNIVASSLLHDPEYSRIMISWFSYLASSSTIPRNSWGRSGGLEFHDGHSLGWHCVVWRIEWPWPMRFTWAVLARGMWVQEQVGRGTWRRHDEHDELFVGCLSTKRRTMLHECL